MFCHWPGLKSKFKRKLWGLGEVVMFGNFYTNVFKVLMKQN